MMLGVVIFVALALVSVSATPHPQPGDSVAIVGGGVHGLFAARRLQRAGYRVTVYEAENELAASTETLNVDGHNFDLGTKYIATNTPTGGLHADFAAIVDELHMTIVPPQPLTSYFPSAPTGVPPLSSLPHVLLPFLGNVTQFVGDLIQGAALLAAYQDAGVRGPADLIRLGFVGKTETYEQYSTRINLPAFTTLMGFLHATFLSGRPAQQSAAYVVNVRRNYAPGTIKALLLAFGVTAQTPNLPPGVVQLLSDPFPGSQYIFEEGYSEFFERLVQHDQIEVKLRARVKKLKVKKSRGRRRQIQVEAKGQPTRRFDYAIVSVRPHHADGKLLKKVNQRMRALYHSASEFDPVYSAAVRIPQPPAVLGSNFTTSLFPASFTFPLDGTATGVNREFSDSDVTIAIATGLQGLSDSAARTQLLASAAAMGFQTTDVLAFHSWEYISVPSAQTVGDDFLTNVAAQQGVNNVFYVGEVMCGAGVITALDWLEQQLPIFFSGL
eukprot:m.230087 g.230087  ORF g.230087 m.230087 type:complete len:497 (+) comp22406_c4_seq1:1372-2862(+)